MAAIAGKPRGETAADKLRALILRSGLSQAEVSRRAGYKSPSGLQTQLESDAAHLHPKVVHKLVDVLSGLGKPPITADEVLQLQYPPARSTPASRVATDVDLSKIEGVALDDGPLGPLKVWASAAGGPEGAMVIDEDTPIERIPRPLSVRDVPDAFAVYLIGDSMAPRWEHGDKLVINPRKPPKAGDDVLLVRFDEDGTQYALVKRLVSQNGTSWHVRQYSPAKDFDLPKKVWQRAWLIVR